MAQKIIEFYIDTYRVEAYNHIMETVAAFNEGDVDKRYQVKIVKDAEIDSQLHCFCMRGTWDAYRLFLITPRVDLNLPENNMYHYSLSHYEED